MKTILYTLLLSIGISTIAQSSFSRKVEEAFEHRNFTVVLDMLSKKNISNLTTKQQWYMAESYRHIHAYKDAVRMYEQLDLEKLDIDIAYLNFAQLLEIEEEYQKAAVYYHLYLQKHPENHLSAWHEASCVHLDELPQLHENITIKALSVNSEENDFMGFIDGENVVIVSSGHSSSRKRYKGDGQHFLDYYTIDPADDGTVNLLDIDRHLGSPLHEGPGFFDKKTQTLYLTRNASMHDVDGERIANLKIYQSKRKGNSWSSVEELSINDKMSSSGHPTGLSGSDFLIYASDREGGHGKTDLYLIKKIGEGWSKPMSLGDLVNTEGHELFPHMVNDSTLYFASNGHGGYGGLDLYQAKISNEKVVSVLNMGKGFNTSKDDFGIVFTDAYQSEGYFSSDRDGGNGGSDIYHFEAPRATNFVVRLRNERGEFINNIKGWYFDSKGFHEFTTHKEGFSALHFPKGEQGFIEINDESYLPISHNFKTKGLKDTLDLVLQTRDGFVEVGGKIVDHDNLQGVPHARVEVDLGIQVYVDTTDDAGNFSFVLPKRKKYEFVMYKEGYLSAHGNLADAQVIDAAPAKKGALMKIENIYYDYNEDYITAQAKPILDSLVRIMQLNPSLQIEVSSHADARGTDSYNEDLSLRRAKSVLDYLKKQNIKSDRLSIRYYGEEKLVNNCGDSKECAEAQHTKNRRTEFRIVSF